MAHLSQCQSGMLAVQTAQRAFLRTLCGRLSPNLLSPELMKAMLVSCAPSGANDGTDVHGPAGSHPAHTSDDGASVPTLVSQCVAAGRLALTLQVVSPALPVSCSVLLDCC